MSGQGIFEIREYIDSDGKIEKHDVRDISKELEYFSKLCATDENCPGADINDDDQFVRELALLSEGIDPHADDADFLDNYIEQDVAPTLSASKGTQSGRNAHDAKQAKPAASGWKKGFLGKSPTVHKTVDHAAPGPANPKSSVLSPVEGSQSSATESVKDEETEEARGDTREGALPAPVVAPSTMQQAFTGSVLERAPAAPQPIAARVPGQNTILLGPKARSPAGGPTK